MQPFRSERGSLLITALIFAAVIAISLGSFLNLSLNAAKLGNRSFYLNAAQNLVDIGLEHTVWALNDERPNPTDHWTRGGFAAGAGGFQATFPSATTSYPLSGGATGRVKVWTILIPGVGSVPDQWHTVARATVTLGDGTTLGKTAECYLQQRSYSEGGMIARNGISFVGDVKVDSWKSRYPTAADDRSYATAVAEPSTSLYDLRRRSEAQIACPTLVSLQNADVFGYASIGTPDLTGITVGATGRLTGDFLGGTGIVSSRVNFNFTSSFPDVPPETGLSSITPITGYTTLTNGRYTVGSIDLSAMGDNIQIAPGATVVLVVTGDVAMRGNAKIIIPANSRLTMLVGGNVAITGGAGVLNGTSSPVAPNNPDRFTLLGTRTEAQVTESSYGPLPMQNWVIRGIGFFSGVIYAPNADMDVDGGADTYGSVVGNRVRMVGGGEFHQDESLAQKRISGLWGLVKWRELSTPASRAPYSTQLSF